MAGQEFKTTTETHDHDHVLTMSGPKRENYFKFLEQLEDDTFRKAFAENPQDHLQQFGIEFGDLTSDIVKGRLPDPAQLREYRLALEEAAAESPRTSHGHLIWDFMTGQSPLTRKSKS